jgi:glycerol-3-phosphate O-acyltransferase 3/4
LTYRLATAPSQIQPRSSLKGRKLKSEVDLVGIGDERDHKQQGEVSQRIDDFIVAADERAEAITKGQASFLMDVLDISGTLNDAAAAVVDDSFLRCFKSVPDEPWNWNFYLLPLWCVGVVLRNFILFPLRLLSLATGFMLFFIGFSLAGIVLSGSVRKRAERALVQFLAKSFVTSWTGVVRYHGPRPVAAPGRVWVSNHTSMIDYAVLCAYHPFAAIMQLHPGWVGMMQKRYLSALGCLWFNRTQAKDRALVQQRMRDHVWSADATPLLIFPEGTCVNNEHCVMFKRGAFDLGATVCPVAIKYNKIFVDAFWNSKRESFTANLFKIMRSWALVADVWFLEPQQRRQEETAQQFAERVQKMIADKARLRIAPWDGYLKYYNLGEKHPDLVERQRSIYAQRVRRWLQQGEVGQED